MAQAKKSPSNALTRQFKIAAAARQKTEEEGYAKGWRETIKTMVTGYAPTDPAVVITAYVVAQCKSLARKRDNAKALLPTIEAETIVAMESREKTRAETLAKRQDRIAETIRSADRCAAICAGVYRPTDPDKRVRAVLADVAERLAKANIEAPRALIVRRVMVAIDAAEAETSASTIGAVIAKGIIGKPKD